MAYKKHFFLVLGKKSNEGKCRLEEEGELLL